MLHLSAEHQTSLLCCCCWQIHARNLAPALEWAEANRERLCARDERSAEAFAFQLHRLQFLHTLQQQGAALPPELRLPVPHTALRRR